jgi:hypothetical protein
MSILRPALNRLGQAQDTIELRPGDHLDQPTFHRRYEAMPEGFRAELIGGVVMVPLAVSATHAEGLGVLATWLNLYRFATPGTLALLDGTIILGPESEPQPDGVLLILPEHGGQTRREGEYVAGPPELVAEVAYASHSCDLHSKLRDYERAGVREYIVLVGRSKRVERLSLRDGRFQRMPAGEDGVLRSEIFPGLWLDPAVMMAREGSRVVEVLQRGLASPEHSTFVDRLKEAQRPHSP